MIPGRWKARLSAAAPWISLASGIWSAFFVVRRYEQARRVGWLLLVAWAMFGVVALLRRRRGQGRLERGAEFAAAWIGQSAAQEILFFTLPFWIRSTTWTSRNAPFTVLLVLVALTVAIDPIYRRILSNLRVAAVHKSLVQFAALGFLLPVLRGAPTQGALALAGALAGGIAALAAGLRRPFLSALVGGFAGAALVVSGAAWIAPVPLRLEDPVLCSRVDGRLPVDTLETVRRGSEVWAWTPVFAPEGYRDDLLHVWHRDGREIARVPLRLEGGRKEGFRTWSSSRFVATTPGSLRLDVLNGAGQVVGRLRGRVE